MAALHPGDAVEVFFRHGHDPLESFPVTDAYSAQLRPRVACTDGWLPAICPSPKGGTTTSL